MLISPERNVYCPDDKIPDKQEEYIRDMKGSIQDILDRNRIMVIDGSMSTALEELGADNNSRLWTAGTLAASPDLVRQVHYNYFQAGADCGITCSYQATIPGLTENGYTEEEAEKIIADSVRLFIEARDEWWEAEGKAAGRAYPVCLAGVGPYGAYLADGSEYRGNYGVSDEVLYDFHRRRLEILKEAGTDVMLIETQPSLKEALIAAGICEELETDYWVSFSCRDDHRICEGDLIEDCAAAFAEGFPHLRMIGVNCTKPDYIAVLIRRLKAASGLPIGVYPNSGLVYDPDSKTWSKPDEILDFGAYALSYMKAGAVAVGGCCTTSCGQIREVAAARDTYLSSYGRTIDYKGL